MFVLPMEQYTFEWLGQIRNDGTMVICVKIPHDALKDKCLRSEQEAIKQKLVEEHEVHKKDVNELKGTITSTKDTLTKLETEYKKLKTDVEKKIKPTRPTQQQQQQQQQPKPPNRTPQGGGRSGGKSGGSTAAFKRDATAVNNAVLETEHDTLDEIAIAETSDAAAALLELNE